MHLVFAALLACDPGPEALPPAPAEPTAPDILLVTIDTLRADRVGAYGDPLAETPNLDALAGEGVLFREAHAVTPLTLPSHASILTGRYPANHGLRDNGGFRLDTDVPLLAEVLQAEGYATAAFVSAYVLDGAWGLDRGFDVYRDPFHPQDVARSGAFGELELPGAEVVNAAAAWWKGAEGSSKPRFAWVHLYDPHTPWREHAGWEGDPYRGEVHYADTLVGQLLRRTDPGDIVVVTSDHGEGLWDHGEREHGVLLGRSITRVPLLFRPPEAPAAGGTVAPRVTGRSVVRRPDAADPALQLDPVPDAPRARRVVDLPVSGVDIAPTLADYAGASLPGVDGRSLRPLIEGASLPDRAVYAETWFPHFHYGWKSLHMAQDAQQRVEQGAWTQQWDWTTNPTGAEVPRSEDVAPGLDATLRQWRGEQAPRPGPIPGDQAAALEALGYIASTTQPRDDAPDPRDEVDLLGRLHAAEAAPPAEGIRLLEALVAAHPDMTAARLALAFQRYAAGDKAGALRENQSILEALPDHPTALANAAALGLELEQPELTLRLAAQMRRLNPHDPRGYRLAAAVHVDNEDPVAVMKLCREGVERAPEDPNLHYLLGLAELQQGDPLVAVQHLEDAQRFGSRAGDIELWIGAGLQQAGRIDEARVAYDKAAKTMTRDHRPWAMSAWMLYKADRCEDARPYLVNLARRGLGRDAKIAEAIQACGLR